MTLDQQLKHTGTLVNYYFVCKRKLWLFAHQINFETESDTVALGRLLSEISYDRQKKEIKIDEMISIDWIDFRNKVIHEVKKSDKLEEAHLWQVKYYLYFLESKGVQGFRAEINYPKFHKRELIELIDSDREYLKEVIKEIEEILPRDEIPEKVRIPACRSCSYFEFCWV
ncbi:MAG TPA: CRISPR-associated protein Cas4 [Thermodesulfobacteriota bacterium]|nr:CRISPR-associated protein Cas4 [Thermodesulfobacteriota bacterium]